MAKNDLDSTVHDIIRESVHDIESPEPAEIAASEPVAGDETPDPVDPVEKTPEASAPVEPAKEPAKETEKTAVSVEKTAVSAVKEPVIAAPVEVKKRRGPLPYDRHEAILTNERNKHETAIKELTAKTAAYEQPEFQQRLGAILIAEREPGRFVEMLDSDPRYQAIFKAKYGTPAPPPAVEPPPPALELPKPNVVLEDGRLAYDEAGAAALAQYHASAVEQKLSKELAELKSALEPVTKERQTQAEAKKDWDAAIERQTKALTEARTWRGFAEAEPQIKALVLSPEGQGLTLHQAYQKVVLDKAFEDDAAKETRIRAAIEADIQRRAAAGQAVPAAGGAPAARSTPGARAAQRSAADIVRESIRGLK